MTSNVSVIIRTIGRPSLRRAIESVEQQNRSDVEIVIVAATPNLEPVDSRICTIRWLATDAPLRRCVAANVGLQAARGQYLIFLDDDDWFESGHLEKLIVALESHPDVVLAHTGIRSITETGERELDFDSPFEPWQLMAAPRFPIHAALIRRSAIEAGRCRFDPGLDVYEDWDFWLQLQKVGPFVHVPGVSAVYLYSASGSGVQSISYGAEPYRRLWRKWGGLYDSSWLAALFEQVIQLPRMRQDIDALRAEHSRLIEERSGLIGERSRLIEERNGLNASIEVLRATLDAVLNSTSWKLTAPLRGVAIWGRRIILLLNSARALLREPSLILPTLHVARSAFAASGWRGAEVAFRDIQKKINNDRDCNYLWRCYRRDVERTIPDWCEEVRLLARHPKISVIIPSYETPTSLLREAINSVLAQVYSEWELIIADDASPSPHVLQIVNEYVTQDSRIQSLPGLTNFGVSATSNRAIAAATGEFVVLLDHDDKLEPHALLRVAQSIVSDDPDFVYSDETLLTEDGTGVIDFVFRPAFSLEFLRSHPYIVHLVGFRTRLLQEIGGFNEKLRISQDYDLILRVCEHARTVVHLPELLYCWRIRSSSSGYVQQDQVPDVSRSILDAHLKRCGEDGYVEQSKIFNFYDVRYKRDPAIRVAIIIPTKNCSDLVRLCIESIDRTVTEVAYHIVLVDHHSDEVASINYFNSLQPRCTVLRYAGVFNFSAINNWATAQLGDGFTHYLYCNNDIEAIKPGWLERMVELAQKPDVGIVGAILLYPDQSVIQHGGVTIGLFDSAEHNGKFMARNLPNGRIFPGYRGALVANHEISAVTGACLLMRKDAFLKVAGYDEKLAVGFGDVDLCLRVRSAGYRVLLCPNAVLVHNESYTRGKSKTDPHPVDSAFFLARWRNFIDSGDPFFNPNLFTNSTAWEFNSPLPVSVAGCRRVTRLDRLKEISLNTLNGPK